MDGFSYHNIFDTKGAEYLAIIAFLVLLIPFWLILNKNVKIVEHIRKAVGVLTANILRIPQGIFYGRNHTWAYMGKTGVASIGLDDLLLHITGEVSVRHLKNKDDIIRKGDLIAEVTRQGRSLNIFSPVSGKILDINPALHLSHELLAKDPYGEGWLYNLKPTNWVEEIPSCFLSEDATNWLKSELERYKDFVAINIGKYSDVSSFTVLQDGGEIADNSLSALPEGMWNDFQKEFLDLKETI